MMTQTSHYTDWTDDDLYLAVCEGNKSARDFLWVKWTPVVYSFLLRKGLAEEVAHDVAAEALLSLWEKCNSFTPMGKFAGFLFAVTRSQLKEFRDTELKEDRVSREGKFSSRKTGRTIILHPLEKHGVDVVRDVWARLSWNKYVDCLLELPEKQCYVWRLARELQLSRDEIAEHTKIVQDTVATHVKHAKKSLVVCMGEYASPWINDDD